MCGIVGIIDAHSIPERALIEKMCRTMAHRGPDGEGYYLDGPVALGHRRLSIIDLAGGKQPMSNEDGTAWITFNGEIYNFPELRRELIQKGHRFTTRSDTETIVHAYEEYGTRCVEKFRGMFAFGIWDDRKKMLFLGRDRLGKKPLYYYSDGRKFIFASEIKAIIQDPLVTRRLDITALSDYLTYNYIPFPETIFQGIYKLPPAHTIVVTFKPDARAELVTQLSQYWDIKYEPDDTLSEEQWAEALRNKLTEAVKMRLISDVPLGAFLSGGLDSSTVVALMSMLQNKPVKTFSIGFKEEDFSETTYARQIADKFGTEHHELIVEPDAIEVLSRLAWEFDEPFADSSAIPTYYVSKMAREHVTVVLSGDGGDETFAGYRRYAWADQMKRFDWIPGILRKAVFGIPARLLPEGMKGKGMLRHLSRDPFQRYAGLNTFDEPGYIEGLLSKDMLEQSGYGRNGSHLFLKKYYDDCNGADYLTRIQYVDTKSYLAEDILTKVDRASMLCSLETRAPLLDHEVIELAARMPSRMKLRKGESKYILKKAMKDILPEEVLYRKKMGFGVPLGHWFKKELTGYAEEVLLSKAATERGIFNQASVKKVLEIHRKMGRDMSARIWALLFFEHWCLHWQ